MKLKKITFLLCIMCMFQTHAQFDGTEFLQSPETITTEIWSDTNWDAGPVTESVFDDQCRVVMTTTTFAGSGLSRILYEYNSESLVSQTISQVWNNTTWENSQLNEFTYINGNIDTDTKSIWFITDWMLFNRTDNNYNASNQLEEVIIQQRNITNTGWDNTTRTAYTYNGSGLEIVELFQTWSAGMWNNSEQVLTSYNASDLVLERIYQTASGMNWINFERETAMYLGSELSSVTLDSWDGSDWVPDGLDVFTYDGDQNLIQSETSIWDGSAYTPSERTMIAYNTDGLISQITAQEYIMDDWENVVRITITYPACASLSISENAITDISMYPNPANDHISISGLPEDVSDVSYDIFDVSGRSVQKDDLKANNKISVHSLSSGLYLVKLNTEAGSITERIVIKH